MIYRTDCGCVASRRDEPSIAEYGELEDYQVAHAAWAEEWERQASDHVQTCPRSAYVNDALLTYRDRRSGWQDYLDAQTGGRERSNHASR